jgi:hypothetical protein
LNAEICAVSNVQEEVGLLGARQIAYSLKPDIALVVDVTHATDYPTVSKTQHGDVKIGGGPALTHGGCNHPAVVARLEEVAAKKKIPLQHEAMSATSGTDTDAIFWTRGGIASALISLPNRYMHSPVEVVSLKDLELIPATHGGLRAIPQKGRRVQGEDLTGRPEGRNGTGRLPFDLGSLSNGQGRLPSGLGILANDLGRLPFDLGRTAINLGRMAKYQC